MSKKNFFVFVVCGGKEHIDELNFSIKYLKHFSKNKIIVITDLERNEIPIEHDNIINFKTPSKYSNHQASIFLKTSIHRYLPKGNCYFYLDGDIVAITHKVDTVFNLRKGVINFANDHCVISEFSQSAVNCNCNDKDYYTKHESVYKYRKALLKSRQTLFIHEMAWLNSKVNIKSPLIKKQSEEIASFFRGYKKYPVKNFFKIIRYFLLRYLVPVDQFSIESKYTFYKKDRCWYNANDDVVMFDYHHYEKQIWEICGIRWNPEERLWETKKGKKFELLYPEKSNKCNHLTKYLNTTYALNIPDDWQHWNGGVFLFDEDSVEFLEYWHQITIEEFDNPYTKTRDQATLAVAAWKFNLQNQDRLPEEFDFIAEYENRNIKYNSRKGFTKDNFKTVFEPCFLHIYHSWGDTQWSIWNGVMKIGKDEKII